jgi:hypothetical protein
MLYKPTNIINHQPLIEITAPFSGPGRPLGRPLGHPHIPFTLHLYDDAICLVSWDFRMVNFSTFRDVKNATIELLKIPGSIWVVHWAKI